MPSSKVKEHTLRLIRIFVDGSLSLDKDAGWHQTSMLQRLIEHRGELPRYTGSAGSSEDKMLREIRYVRDKHPLLEDSKILFAKLPVRCRLALYLYERFGKTPNPDTGKLLGERELAAMAGLTKPQFHNARSRGLTKAYKIVDELLKTHSA